MSSEEDFSELVKNAKRVVCQMQEKTFEGCNTTVDVAGITQQLQHLTKTKQDVKDKFHKTLTINNFMKNLTLPRNQWDAVVSRNEEELQRAKRTLKEAQHRMDDQKSKAMNLNAVAAETLALYQQNLKSLEERLHTLEKMCQDLRTLQESLNGGGADDESLTKEVQAQLSQCSAEAQQCRRELQRVQHQRSQAELRVTLLQEDLHQMGGTLDPDQEKMDAQCLLRLQKSISSTEALSGVTCKISTSNTIIVQFPPNQSASRGTEDDLVLHLTLTFQKNSLGSLRLSSVESNMESLDLDDLQLRESSVDSVPSLVHDVKQRWLSHMPMLSEINQLRCKFAIDWIQQESVLRVIVGKGGGIVCSLLIPSGYPRQGQVTLTSIIGAPDSLALEDLKPSTGKRLEDWVQFLEDTFGKP
ncbi:hypothetical protein ACOMHN_033556 [Nucella lapillus]